MIAVHSFSCPTYGTYGTLADDVFSENEAKSRMRANELIVICGAR